MVRSELVAREGDAYVSRNRLGGAGRWRLAFRRWAGPASRQQRDRERKADQLTAGTPHGGTLRPEVRAVKSCSRPVRGHRSARGGIGQDVPDSSRIRQPVALPAKNRPDLGASSGYLGRYRQLPTEKAPKRDISPRSRSPAGGAGERRSSPHPPRPMTPAPRTWPARRPDIGAARAPTRHGVARARPHPPGG